MKLGMKMGMNAGWKLVAIAMLGATLAGCDTTRAPYAPAGDPLVASNYPKVAFLDKELTGMLVVDPNIVVVDRPEGRPMKVTVPMRSVSDHAMKLQYQYIWRDALGRPVGNPSGWKYVVVEPRVQVPMQANAISMDATDWRLEIRFER